MIFSSRWVTSMTRWSLASLRLFTESVLTPRVAYVINLVSVRRRVCDHHKRTPSSPLIEISAGRISQPSVIRCVGIKSTKKYVGINPQTLAVKAAADNLVTVVSYPLSRFAMSSSPHLCFCLPPIFTILMVVHWLLSPFLLFSSPLSLTCCIVFAPSLCSAHLHACTYTRNRCWTCLEIG